MNDPSDTLRCTGAGRVMLTNGRIDHDANVDDGLSVFLGG